MKNPDFLNAAGRKDLNPQRCSICPLNRVQAGATVRIREITAPAETCRRLREIGFCEEQVIHLVAHHGNIICQVQNCRMGIGARLAESILVEQLAAEA
ncbi:MAG: ferrous iron transport protein A [Verrucomicrobia bacterium]|nr:ferrous iron transport protein A [Verrucomicrobiota bacterium]